MDAWIVFVIIGVVLVLLIVLAIWSWRRFTRPNTRINPETRQEAEATVERVRYQGSASVGVGFVSRQRPLFGVRVDVPGVGKMRARIVLQDETGFSMANDFRSMGRWFGQEKPYMPGDIVRVEYDSTRPKRCNILTPTRQIQQQMASGQPMQQQPHMTHSSGQQ